MYVIYEVVWQTSIVKPRIIKNLFNNLDMVIALCATRKERQT